MMFLDGQAPADSTWRSPTVIFRTFSHPIDATVSNGSSDSSANR
jgi:hypothetical protein